MRQMITARLMQTISCINSRRCERIEVHRAHIAIRGLLAPLPPPIVGRGSGLCDCSIRSGASAPADSADAKPGALGATRPLTPAYRWQRLRALRLLNQEWRKRPCRFSRRKALRIGGYSPPYPHLSLAEAPGFATAQSGVAQAPLQIQQTQGPPHRGLLAPIPPLIVDRLAATNPDHHPYEPPLQALSPRSSWFPAVSMMMVASGLQEGR